MGIIVPTVTAEEPHGYRAQIENVQDFAKRIHIDLMDGIFTPNKSVEVNQIWWPDGITADIHLMYQNPEMVLNGLIALKSDLVVIQAESDCDIASFSQKLNAAGIKCGISLLPKTTVESVKSKLVYVDHVLIFSGNLGYQGGSVANLALLSKIEEIKAVNSNLEIAWDGGVNDQNVSRLVEAGINVINVGGFVQKAPDAGLAYSQLIALLP